jgi:hypothetical protein
MGDVLKKEGVGGTTSNWEAPASPRYMRALLEFQVARRRRGAAAQREASDILRRYAKDVHVFLREPMRRNSPP